MIPDVFRISELGAKLQNSHWERTRESVIIVSNRIPVSVAGGSPRQYNLGVFNP